MVRKDTGYNDKKHPERQLIEKGIGVTFAPWEKRGGGRRVDTYVRRELFK